MRGLKEILVQTITRHIFRSKNIDSTEVSRNKDFCGQKTCCEMFKSFLMDSSEVIWLMKANENNLIEFVRYYLRLLLPS